MVEVITINTLIAQFTLREITRIKRISIIKCISHVHTRIAALGHKAEVAIFVIDDLLTIFTVHAVNIVKCRSRNIF